MQEFLEQFTGLDWSPLFITLKTAFAATVVAFFVGIVLAYAVMKSSTKVKAVIDDILTLPMVLPPTVAGFILLLPPPAGNVAGGNVWHTNCANLDRVRYCGFYHCFSADVPHNQSGF